MEFSQRNTIIGAVLILIVGVGAYLYTNRTRVEPRPIFDGIATTTSASGTTTNIQVKGDTSTTINVGGTAKTPSYTAPILFSGNISEEAKSAFLTQFSAITAKLAKNTNQMDLWLSLGTLRKMAGDYVGAVEDWKFVAVDENSLSYIAYGNLADLYSNFVKDYPKAEASYLAAIKLEPKYIDFYRGLFTLYSNVYKKGTSAAEDILKQGIATNPGDVDLHVMLAQYYKTLGRTADAKAEYGVAIKNAQTQGDTQVVNTLQQELDSL